MSSFDSSRRGKSHPAKTGERLVGADGSVPRVLLAEDSDTARGLLKALLERMGCRVDAVCDGQEAVVQACLDAYDVILMDMEMPVLDGLNAALEIRSVHCRAARTPIVALSALITDISSRPVLEAAFDAALVKPARRSDLYRVLHQVITASCHGPKACAAPTPHDESIAQEPINFAEQARIFGNLKQSQQQALIRLAIRELEDLSGQLNGAVDSRSCDQVRHIVHRIRGTAANFAATPLAGIAAALEKDCRASLPDDITDRSTALGDAVALAVLALKGQCIVEQQEGPVKASASA